MKIKLKFKNNSVIISGDKDSLEAYGDIRVVNKYQETKIIIQRLPRPAMSCGGKSLDHVHKLEEMIKMLEQSG